MKTSRVASLLVLLLVAACASRPAGPPPLDPVGNYEFTSSVDGQPIGGTIEIAGTPGAYTGTINVHGMASLPITSVTVQGQVLRIAALLDGQPVDIHLTSTGDTFTGSWSSGDTGGALSGRRIR